MDFRKVQKFQQVQNFSIINVRVLINLALIPKMMRDECEGFKHKDYQ